MMLMLVLDALRPTGFTCSIDLNDTEGHLRFIIQHLWVICVPRSFSYIVSGSEVVDRGRHHLTLEDLLGPTQRFSADHHADRCIFASLVVKQHEMCQEVKFSVSSCR
jgi:hypothetical protein